MIFSFINLLNATLLRLENLKFLTNFSLESQFFIEGTSERIEIEKIEIRGSMISNTFWMKFSGEILINNLFVADLKAENAGIFFLKEGGNNISISNSTLMNILLLPNSSLSGFFFTSVNLDFNLTMDSIKISNNSLDGTHIFYIENNKGMLKVSNSYFNSNKVLALIRVKILYQIFFSNVSCVDNNDFSISGSCFYLENICIQNFSFISIENSKSNSLAAGIIFIDDKTTLNTLAINSKFPYVLFSY